MAARIVAKQDGLFGCQCGTTLARLTRDVLPVPTFDGSHAIVLADGLVHLREDDGRPVFGLPRVVRRGSVGPRSAKTEPIKSVCPEAKVYCPNNACGRLSIIDVAGSPRHMFSAPNMPQRFGLIE